MSVSPFSWTARWTDMKAAAGATGDAGLASQRAMVAHTTSKAQARSALQSGLHHVDDGTE